MILLHWQTLFHLIPYYLASITSSDNKTVKHYNNHSWVLPLHTCSAHTVVSSVYPSFYDPHHIFSLGGFNLAVSLISLLLCVLHLLNSPLRQAAEAVCVCVSWALTLFFSLSWRQLPWGVLSAWEHKGSPGARPYTHQTDCVFESVSVCGFCEQESEAAYSGITPVCLHGPVFIPFRWWDPNSQFLPPDTGSWFEKKKKITRSTPKHSWKHVHVQKPTLYPRQTIFYHTALIISWKHFYGPLISPFSNPSAGSPHPGGLTLTKREIMFKS